MVMNGLTMLPFLPSIPYILVVSYYSVYEVNWTTHLEITEKQSTAYAFSGEIKMYGGGDNLVLALCSVHFAGDVSCNAVSDGLALDSGDFTDDFLVVFEVSVEACRVLF